MHLMIISSRHYLPLQPLYMPDGPVFTCELTFFGTLITFLLALYMPLTYFIHIVVVNGKKVPGDLEC